jgi:hypothetical protein
MEQAIASGDPEFHIDEKKWSNELQAATVTVNSRGIAPSAHRELELKIQELTELVQKFINQTPAAGSNSS